ncbi:MAG: hypothetical protein HYX26_04330 [Acidobacteriales bacterium]|nr:hypothetical protein [Terriglobales bacterium]
MQKILRFVAVALFAVAAYATVTAPSAQAQIEKKSVLHEGSSPVPLCRPGTICVP